MYDDANARDRPDACHAHACQFAQLRPLYTLQYVGAATWDHRRGLVVVVAQLSSDEREISPAAYTRRQQAYQLSLDMIHRQPGWSICLSSCRGLSLLLRSAGTMHSGRPHTTSIGRPYYVLYTRARQQSM